MTDFNVENVKTYTQQHPTYKKDFLKATAELIHNSTHVRNEDEDTKRTQAAEDHEDLSTRILRNYVWHPAEKYETHLKTVDPAIV